MARRVPLTFALAALVAALSLCTGFRGVADANRPRAADRALSRAINSLVRSPGGPPGVAVVVQRGRRLTFHGVGVADLATRAPVRAADHMRLASVSKAFSAAAALSLVAEGRLHLNDTVGQWLPGVTPLWGAVTLRELLQHTSGIPDFSKSQEFQEALGKSLLEAPLPTALVGYVEGQDLEFPPGTEYRYSNSDNILVALIVQAAAQAPYEHELERIVYRPLGLRATSLPRSQHMPVPAIRGYVEGAAGLEDVTELFAAGWTWSSGGIVSTPLDANRFIRAYVRGAFTNRPTRRAQLRFVSGSSEPEGPGRNAAGLGIFRYRTRCGTVYGHTGNTLGFTQFAASSADGTRSAVVQVNAQITPTSAPAAFVQLQAVEGSAVCAALAG